jgi:KamA family protein
MDYRTYTLRNFREIPQLEAVPEEKLNDVDVVARVLPFKTNNYVVDELIDWDNYASDPIFLLNFPQRDMLSGEHYRAISKLIRSGADRTRISRAADEIRTELNPHPAGQREYNVPVFRGELLKGIQHKYRETVLFFPSQGQTCHAYCTFCFRWPQFTGMSEMKFAMRQTEHLVAYLREHPEVTDVLITGGDPMIMNAGSFARHINTLLEADLPSLKNIRIGTKTLSFWPYRYVTDPDAKDLLAVFRKITDSGKHLAFMAHVSHPVELSTDIVEEAVSRIRNTGAQIRTQSPVMDHINADSGIWARMWKKQVSLGMIPYYMFIARDTGARNYFSVPLVRAWRIFREAYSRVSGICRTVRGPSMSANPGKVQIVGVADLHGEKAFVLNFLQARKKEWVGRPFFARYDEHAEWLTDLEPVEGKSEFFYTGEFRRMLNLDNDSRALLAGELKDFFERCSGEREG